MDIHKPKPVHSLRDFLSEIGVIVCGVLIALGLEQAVEAAHWSETVHEAKAAIHEDLALAAVFAEERLARLACADAYLDGLAAAVAASPDAWRPKPFDYCGLPHTTVYVGPWRPWPTEVWRSIEAAGTVGHFDARYRQQAPFTFSFIDRMAQLTADERRLATDLSPLGLPLALTPEVRLELLRTIFELRSLNDQLAILSRDLNGNIRELGETPREAELKARRAEVPGLFVRPGLLTNVPPEPRPRT